jgi:hypothetical protein
MEVNAVLYRRPIPRPMLRDDDVNLVAESCRMPDERLEERSCRVPLELRVRRRQDEDVHEARRLDVSRE